MSGDFQTHKDNQPHKTYAKVDLDKYAVFVDGVTSDPSKNYKSFIDSLSSLDGKGAHIEPVSYTHLTLPTKRIV